MDARAMVQKEVMDETGLSAGSVSEFLSGYRKGPKVYNAMTAWLSKQAIATAPNAPVVIQSPRITTPAPSPRVASPPPIPVPVPASEQPAITREDLYARVAKELVNPVHFRALRDDGGPGYVYVMVDGNTRYSKIGKTKDLMSRIGNEGQGNPHLQTVLQVRSSMHGYLERVIHRILEACKAEYIPPSRLQGDSRACEFFSICTADAMHLLMVVHTLVEYDPGNRIKW